MKSRVVILGAGVTGLSAAYRLSQFPEMEVHVVEKESEVGGLCRSFQEGAFTLDYGPHKFYSNVPGVTEHLCEIMGDEFLVREKVQKIFMDGKYFSFPLSLFEMLTRFSPLKSVQILVSFGWQAIKNIIKPKSIATYSDFVVAKFGNKLYQSIFQPMAKKMFGNPEKLDRRLAEIRISSPGLVAVLKNVLFSKKVDRNVSAPEFHYPKAGFGRIPAKLREKAEANGVKFHLGATVKRIEHSHGKVQGVRVENSDGTSELLPCDQLVYTIPMQLIGELIPELPAEVRQASRFVRYRHTIVYYFLLKSPEVLPGMWVFYPGSEFRFGRLSEMTKFSPALAPTGHTALMADFTCLEEDPEWGMNDEQLGDRLMQQLKPLNLFSEDQVVKRFSKRFKNFYPVYDVGYESRVKRLRDLETQFNNLYFVGRVGDFNYNNSDQCFDMGYSVANHIHEKQQVGTEWSQLRSERFEKYRIVD
ncbi:FAD-dependent oxidoreductase [bacterium]|nr:FAD-dependent oxidoreductase [bacterium]